MTASKNIHSVDLSAFRKRLHQRPEISGSEHQTAKTIIHFLNALNPDSIITGLGGTGVIAVFKGNKPGDHVLFRCELDALPIQETNQFEHRSEIDGIAHKCGHDGHMTIICGLAVKFAVNRNFSGQRIVLFQPAEETGQGAIAVTRDPRFIALKVDFCYALHNLPGIPLGQVQIRPGTFNCASCGLSIKITGAPAHAAYPDQGRSPAEAMIDMLQKLITLNDQLPSHELQMITLIYSSLGEKSFGTTPAIAEIGLTLRTESNQSMHKLKDQVLTELTKIADHHRFDISTTWHDVFMASVNDESCAIRIAHAAQEVGQDVVWLEQAFRWSEDFGAISATARGAMFVLGSGVNTPQIHDASYDFPDELIKPAIRIFYQISKAHQ